jgi:hypothetical protein
VLLHEICQPVEHTVERRHGGAEQGLQDRRVFEQAVQVQAQDVSRGVLPPSGCACGAGQRHAGKVAGGGHRGVLGGLAMVDFITQHGHAPKAPPTRR